MDNWQHQSEQIGKLVEALCAAKLEYPIIKADDQGQRKKFVSIDFISFNIEPILAKHGIKVIQRRVMDGDKVILKSSMIHISGEFINAFMPLHFDKNNGQSYDQGYGASTTYQRRYDLYGLLGLGKGEDNDPDSIQQSKRSKQSSQPKKEYFVDPNDNSPISIGQVNYLRNNLNGDKETEQDICQFEGINRLEELGKNRMSMVLAFTLGEIDTLTKD